MHTYSDHYEITQIPKHGFEPILTQNVSYIGSVIITSCVFTEK